MKPWIIVLIVLAVIAVILGLLYYFGKKAQTTSSSGFTINNLFAACIICLLPIAVFYIFASRQLMAGLTAGAVKG